jgi:hypothetical protein
MEVARARSGGWLAARNCVLHVHVMRACVLACLRACMRKFWIAIIAACQRALQ